MSEDLGTYLEYCRHRARRKYQQLKLVRKGVLISPKEHKYVPFQRRNELYQAFFQFFKNRMSHDDYNGYYREISKEANATYVNQSAPFVDLIRSRLSAEQMVQREMTPLRFQEY